MLRDFLTVPLLLSVPFLFPYRRCLLPVCAHNLQAASRRRLDRVALRILHRLGFTFVIPETLDGLRESGLGWLASRAVVLPLAIPSALKNVPSGPKPELIVGVVGAHRAEKNSDALVHALPSVLDHEGIAAKILVGRPGGDSAAGLAGRILYVDTATDPDYRRALASCSVVCLGYSREHYELRASGVVLDAAAAHAAVVCPDFPLFRAQVSWPNSVGSVFRSIEGLGAAIVAALEIAKRNETFVKYLEGRAADSVVIRLQEELGKVAGGCRRA